MSLAVGSSLALAAALVTPLMPAVDRGPTLALFFIAVAISAAVGGAIPALLTALGSVVMLATLHIPPLAPGVLGWDAQVRLVTFLGVTTVIAFLGELNLRSTRRERARREWSEVTLRSIADGVVVTDAEGHVRSMNLVAEALTGWKSGEAIGRPLTSIFRIVDEATRSAVEDPVTRVRRGDKTVGIASHTVLVRRDGTETPIDESGAPIWSEDGRLAGAVVVFRDVSQRRAAERETVVLLERERLARLDAEDANRAKDEFLATLSHELRTPLNAMLGWTQLLRERPSGESELRHGLEVIDRNVRRLARLIDDVLDVSRVVAGKLRLDVQPVAISRVIDAALEVVRNDAVAKGVRIESALPSDPRVMGDAGRLQQVFWNLLSNAIKFSARGGSVRVSLVCDRSFVEVSVQDEGVGIEKAFLPYLFDPFRQEDATSRRSHGGLGLGLALVRHLVEMHGGTVEGTSEGRGRGATFTVRLPLRGAIGADAGAEAARAQLPATSLAGIRVLAVDDDADARDLLQRLLERAGAEVRTAASVDQALTTLRSWPPDVLLSDLEMPDQDGFALIRRIRKEGWAELPAIALTAYAGAEHRARALEAGFQLHVPKPLGQREIELVVAAASRLRADS